MQTPNQEEGRCAWGPATASSALANLADKKKKIKMQENARLDRADLKKRYTGIECREELGAEMYFKGGEKASQAPPMISYWTWQIGCAVAMDARQSLSSSANQAERRAQRLP